MGLLQGSLGQPLPSHIRTHSAQTQAKQRDCSPARHVSRLRSGLVLLHSSGTVPRAGLPHSQTVEPRHRAPARLDGVSSESVELYFLMPQRIWSWPKKNQKKSGWCPQQLGIHPLESHICPSAFCLSQIGCVQSGSWWCGCVAPPPLGRENSTALTHSCSGT